MYSQQLSDTFHENYDISNNNNHRILSYIYNCNHNILKDSILLNILQERALIMRRVEWVPKSNVPNNAGYFSKDKKVIGLPYSSVKELQKFIGLDVSIYTFLTAVNNPYSLLYTEDVASGKPCYLGGKYNGKNSHTFYGTVCSSFTSYCYDENYNYTSFNYRDRLVSNFHLKSNQNLNNLSGGDLFWCPGHVALITEVERDSFGQVNNILLFESAGTRVSSKTYTPDAFYKRLSGNGNSKMQGFIYSNSLLERSKKNIGYYILSDSIQSLLNTLSFKNDEICTWFGDKPCIGEWDKLMINFFKKEEFDKVLITINDDVIDTLDISNEEHSIEYKFKRPGIYKARLASKSYISPIYTSFEVINTITNIIHHHDDTVEVLFADGSEPEIVFWTNKSGDQYTFPITVSTEEKKEGKMKIPSCNKKDALLRIIYRGKYGRAINKPEHLFL